MKATVEYWYSDLSERTGYKKGQEVPGEFIPEVARKIFAQGLNVMLYHSVTDPDVAYIFVDDKRFQQR